MERLIFIVGPTASGKTALSVALAQRLDAEIVSCDSMQLYRGMDIGTAKPTPEEMGGIVHHMLSVLDPRESCSVSRYCAMAEPCVQDILARGKVAIVTGGTGLYADALESGRPFAPCPQTGRREELTAFVRSEGIGALLERLRAVDPCAAQSLSPSDEKRIIRAMEVYLETGQTITEHNARTRALPAKHHPLRIGLDYVNRSALYRRIDRRVDEMFARGLFDEVRALLGSGVPADATAMQAIGYKELVACLRGEETQEEASARLKQSSRRYAKRQRTWFYRNEQTHWLLLPDEPSPEAVLEQALPLCRAFLETT